jgi:hypothetical protein
VLALVAAMACKSAPSPSPAPPPPPRVVEAPPPPPPPPPLDRDPSRLVDRLLAMFTDVPAALVGPCDGVKAALAGLSDRYADVIAANAKVVSEGRAGELRAAIVARRDEVAAAGRAMMTALTKASCGSDPDFIAAFDKVARP